MTLAAERAEAARLRATFEAAGAEVVECAFLQPAETLLDLYGEDIRARAFVTSDPTRGEVMLRPDFTVPVVQMHMHAGSEPARYTYSGAVFRRQEDVPERASEYTQVGYEVFDRSDPARADADVFALMAGAVADLPVSAVTGDIGILMAAVQGLRTSERRRAALLRHIWRPRRFRALLDRFAGRSPVPPHRAALLAAADPMAQAGPPIGLRGTDEIAARIAALRADAEEGPLPEGQVALIDAVLRVQAACTDALGLLRDIAAELPALSPAVARFAARCDALSAAGVDVGTLAFEASYGRTQMEYYDGFVFGFVAPDRPDLPPVVTGGRYDALTRQLGNGAEIPAVGGVIRPGVVLSLKRGAP